MPEEEPVVFTDKQELLRVISTLEANNVIPPQNAEIWKKQVRSGDIESSDHLVEKVNDFVTGLKPRSGSNASLQEQVVRSEEILQQLGMSTDSYRWEASNLNVVERFMNWGGDMLEGAGSIFEDADFAKELFTFGAYVSDDAREAKAEREAAEGPDFSDHKRQFVKQLLTDKVIDNDQYVELTRQFQIDSDEVSLGSILEQLSDWGITDEVLQGTLEESTTAVWRRENKQAQLVEDQERLAAEEEDLMSDDAKLTRRKQYERLNDEYPGRYAWNADTGYIYEVGSGQLVDANGKAIELDREGNLPEGYAQGTEFWDDAIDLPTPWADNNVDVDTYYEMLDVVQHPDRYHAGGIERFASGDPFIGGFGSNWGIADDLGAQEERFEERYGNRFGVKNQGLIPEDDFKSFREGSLQEFRRPWYDPFDQWALYAGKSSEAIRQDQEWLIEIGALTADDITDGEWGSSEADAIEKMMFEANGKAERIDDIDFDFWSDFWEDEANGGAAGRRKFVAPAYRKLDPASIQLTVEDTVRRQLGRDASQDELAELGQHMADMHRQSFALDVQAMEAEYSAETRAIDTKTAQSSGEVGTIDYEAQFMQKFNETHAAELDRMERTQNVAERQQLVGGALNNFMNQLGGGIGGGSMGGR